MVRRGLRFESGRGLCKSAGNRALSGSDRLPGSAACFRYGALRRLTPPACVRARMARLALRRRAAESLGAGGAPQRCRGRLSNAYLPRDESRRGSKRREVLTSSSGGSISCGLSRSPSSALEQSLSRRQFLVAAGAGAASLALPKLASSARGVHAGGNLVLRWNEAFLEGVRSSRLGPPMVARALAIAHTCIYDAWAAYDNKAVATRLGSSLRRPARERTAANTAQAISFAAHRSAVIGHP